MKNTFKAVRLDDMTAKALRTLASDFEGNTSMTLRKLIRQEAERRGCWPAQEPARNEVTYDIGNQ